ncbi:methylmalonyl-CoA mutase [Nitritalea halalkaliphila LW7]|uniref:Methylmalonyl-CoA mutase n=1 Tax=Nitritalea halalkaliphila LW7 TaxID=1189621 RepID=I5C4C5_9BACT|nr:methylmalonyl-CoA mutase [Nitritalea halalkaliphila LW7]
MIVGVNRYLADEEAAFDIMEVDNDAVRTSQLARLAQLKAERMVKR